MAYIDVDKFAEKICNFQAIDEDCANKMIWLLRTFPTADVKEAKHGYWVKRTSYPMGYNCSECYGFESYKRPFCCVCGAKMDLSEKPTGCERSDT